MDTRKCQVRGPCSADAPCEACLVRRVLRRGRNKAAVQRLGKIYADELRQAAREVLRTSPRVSCSVADLVSQFLAQLIEKPRSVLFGFKAEDGKLGPYLRQAADWRMRDYVASRAVSWPKTTLDQTAEEYDPPDPHSQYRNDHQPTLAEALDRLDATSRWLLQARFGFGPFTKRQSLGTIAAQLHLSAKQVSRRIKALCERLRGELS